MNTKHTDNCTRVFKKYDLSCPRCIELSKGSAPREGWQKLYYESKARNERIWRATLDHANCIHGVENKNPGGYCNICGAGHDFS